MTDPAVKLQHLCVGTGRALFITIDGRQALHEGPMPERVYVCVAYACGHRWLETTSPAYCRNGDHCKVCGRRRPGISMGLAQRQPSDAFVFDRDDGLGPKL